MRKLILLGLFISLGFSGFAEEKRIITSDGVELFVKIEGKGKPCLYIHGGPGSGSFWLEKFFGDFLEENFTMIYLDQRGVGRSGSSENADYSMQRMTRDFEEIRQALGYKTWLTMGHSFGGILQMGYAENYPDAQEGIMMINNTLFLEDSFCNSWGPKASEFLEENYEGCEKDTLPILERIGYLGNKLREKDLFWKMAYSNKENQAIMDATYNDFPNWNYDLGNNVFNFQEYWKNYLPESQKITAPVLFFHGTKDWMVGPEHYKKVNFPNVLFWEYEGGHIPFQENKEDLKEAILTYRDKYNFSKL